MLHLLSLLAIPPGKKLRLALGYRLPRVSLWGRELNKTFSEVTEFVGLSEYQSRRLEYVKKTMNVNCPTFSDFEQMLRETKPVLR
jgi:hypothetical protein